MFGRTERALGAMAAIAIAGCGDDTSGSGGAGGDAASSSSVASTSSVSSSTTTGAATTSTGGAGQGGEGGEAAQGTGGQGGIGQGGEGGEAPGCIALTLEATEGSPGVGFDLSLAIEQELGDPAVADHLVVRHGNAEGTFDLTAAPNDDLATCEQCVFVLEDDGGGLGASARVFFPSAGIIDVVETAFPLAGITIAGLVLVEVTIDEGGASTPVPGGACLTLGEAEVAAVFPEAWYCPDEWYLDVAGCDCNCGAFDPDCDDLEQEILRCGDPHLPGAGLACEPDATCEAPPEWTCDESAFGSSQTCDCGCGVPDVDCLLLLPDQDPWPTEGCEADEVCTPAGTCVAVPPGWTCPPQFFDASDGCDCNCGAYDLDCDDPEQPVLGCSLSGSCTPEGTCGPPGAWTCGAAAWGDGTSCDCDCGVPDVDCDDPDLPVVGCADGEACFVGLCGSPAANDVCATAIPLGPGTTGGSWLGASNDYDPGLNGCATGFPEIGGDVVYSISLLAGQTLTVALDATLADGALWLTTDCANAAAACVAGVDAAAADETLVYAAVADVDLFLIVDQYANTDQEPFQLTVTVTP